MIRKRNGFTLIELLAVIVILAIIALIATPIIIGLIDNARKEAFKDSAYGIIQAGQLSYANDLLSKNVEEVVYTYTNGVETSNPSGKKLNYNGTKPQNGTLIVNTKGQIALALYNGKYCAEKGYTDGEITLSEKEVGDCVIPGAPVVNADTSGANAPEVSASMIPIKWDGTKWIKADVNNEAGANQWYDYGSQMWANVAIVRESARANYTSAAVGTEIHPAETLAYLVWVPRYRYQQFNVEFNIITAQKINIVFENKNTTKSTGIANDQWLTHPAFTYGTTELNGFWVGKFETTGDATTPTILPGIAALTNQNVKTQFQTSQKFNTTTTYGLTTANDSHMMKNLEWGAVAYLSQSDYGKYSNPTYTGAVGLEKEVWVNPDNTQRTGYAGDTLAPMETSTVNAYTTTNGVKASTTGNIYGIYDMSGGTAEYMMAVMYGADGQTEMVANSGFVVTDFDSPTMDKYIDKYAYAPWENDFSAVKLGDATGQVKQWYGDNPWVMNYNNGTWIIRGGYRYDGAAAGVFASMYASAGANGVIGFRTVILGG